MARSRSLVLTAVAALAVASAALGTGEVLKRQAAIARERIGKPLGEDSIAADRVWRRSYAGRPVDVLLLGDSLAAGLGAQRRKETLGGRIAKGVAREFARPVRLRTAAVVGSESHELAGQLAGIPAAYRPDVAIIVVGGNDVTHLNSPQAASAHLARAVRDLRDRDAAVVVGTCPDLGSIRAIPQPLRSLLARMSRHMAHAQARAARRAGARVVSLRRAVGPIFRADPGEMFSVDQFHPSPAGYRRTAQALLPTVSEALRARGVRS